jgi:hypothetical protein
MKPAPCLDGERSHPFICRQIDGVGFPGCMGPEHAPLKPSRESLIATRRWISG